MTTLDTPTRGHDDDASLELQSLRLPGDDGELEPLASAPQHRRFKPLSAATR
jgi:hypothetical protein